MSFLSCKLSQPNMHLFSQDAGQRITFYCPALLLKTSYATTKVTSIKKKKGLMRKRF